MCGALGSIMMIIIILFSSKDDEGWGKEKAETAQIDELTSGQPSSEMIFQPGKPGRKICGSRIG